MRRSLQRRLTLLLGGAILLSAMVAAAASFLLAFGEAQEFQDDLLQQISLGAARQRPALPAQPTPTTVTEEPGDQESRILVLRLPGNPEPAWYRDDLPSGLQTLGLDGERLRVFVHRDGAGEAIVVAQPTAVRNELALNSALRTLLPLLLLLPVMAWLVVRIVRQEFAPVHELARQLDYQAVDRPGPVPDSGLPTEITPFAHAINRLLVRVGNLVDQQRRFVADAAHELRSPLTALAVQAQNLSQAQTLADMRARVAPLQAGIERARRLTEQLLSLARVQSGAEESTAIDVSTLVRDLIAELLPQAEAKRIDLGLDERTQLTLGASAERLRLVLRNVLENAVKYAPAGGEVTVRLYAEGTDAVVDVVDNGPGIPVAERERVFDPFYRRPGAEGTGSGLGLAIARESAFASHGSLTLLDSPDGRGLIVRYRQGLGS